MRTSGNGQRRPEDIQAEIARTRSEMDATLSAIEHRLTPGQLVDQGLDYLRRSGAKEFASNLGGSVKENPLPVTLVGIGLAWLMATGKSSGASASTAPSTSEKLGAAKQQLTESVQSARERASQIGETGREQVRRAKDSMNYMIEEQPLALGAIGLAIGAVLAAVAPRTQKEDELMGGARDQLADKAKELGREQAKKVEQMSQAGKEPSEPKPHVVVQPDTVPPVIQNIGTSPR